MLTWALAFMVACGARVPDPAILFAMLLDTVIAINVIEVFI